MSEPVKCEVCHAVGRRRMSRWAPEGWTYGFALDDDTGSTTVVMACSEACRAAFWRPWDEGSTLDDAMERPTGAHLRARLHDLLDDFSAQRILSAMGSVIGFRHRAGTNVCKGPEPTVGRSDP